MRHSASLCPLSAGTPGSSIWPPPGRCLAHPHLLGIGHSRHPPEGLQAHAAPCRSVQLECSTVSRSTFITRGSCNQTKVSQINFIKVLFTKRTQYHYHGNCRTDSCILSSQTIVIFIYFITSLHPSLFDIIRSDEVMSWLERRLRVWKVVCSNPGRVLPKT